MDGRISLSRSEDRHAIFTLYRQAFPDQDLMQLVADLLAEDCDSVISLVVRDPSGLAGHAAVTVCSVDGSKALVALLGPVAIEPAMQGRGIGTALVRHALDAAARHGAVQACVLGDPGYYGRFGFQPNATVIPPYPIPEAWAAAWQWLLLGGADAPVSGQLNVPAAWQRAELWSD